ncbi:hypothetical protein SAMN06265337_1121 [Hymenobacter gelipurpurascens]|uniref:Uncharacterized protein n=1 Tax=Hymenobacter gelipurpurascens TaxID=89968 RepID=A0A212TFM9_9BACT|nr:hypothetical protein [Hymenobacter gelipurpurascens]SNC64644.1 hypothetical protein SAMN06265337_1121 [Hymenobacter gelipurpurascens]
MQPPSPDQPSAIRQLFKDDPYLHQLLQHQAEQLAGTPGWPDTAADVYEKLLRQIEADVSG